MVVLSYSNTDSKQRNLSQEEIWRLKFYSAYHVHDTLLSDG